MDTCVLAIVNKLRTFPELAGCVIGYEGEGSSQVVSFGSSQSPDSQCVAVIIERVEVSNPASNADLQKAAKIVAGQDGSRNAIITNRSRLGAELVGAGVSCGLTVVSGLGVAAGVAGEVPTGGASTFLIVAAWTGLATGAIQCMNGLVRVGAILAAPDDTTLARWDTNMTYSTSILIVDGLGIASGVASLPFAVRNLWAVVARQRAFLTKGLSYEALRNMNRVQRMQVLQEVLNDAARTSEGRQALVAAAKEAQMGVGSMGAYSGLSVRNAVKLTRIISDETVRRISGSVRDVIVSLAGAGASATPASLVGSASGSVNYIINLLDTGRPPQ